MCLMFQLDGKTVMSRITEDGYDTETVSGDVVGERYDQEAIRYVFRCGAVQFALRHAITRKLACPPVENPDVDYRHMDLITIYLDGGAKRLMALERWVYPNFSYQHGWSSMLSLFLFDFEFQDSTLLLNDSFADALSYSTDAANNAAVCLNVGMALYVAYDISSALSWFKRAGEKAVRSGNYSAWRKSAAWVARCICCFSADSGFALASARFSELLAVGGGDIDTIDAASDDAPHLVSLCVHHAWCKWRETGSIDELKQVLLSCSRFTGHISAWMICDARCRLLVACFSSSDQASINMAKVEMLECYSTIGSLGKWEASGCARIYRVLGAFMLIYGDMSFDTQHAAFRMIVNSVKIDKMYRSSAMVTIATILYAITKMCEDTIVLDDIIQELHAMAIGTWSEHKGGGPVILPAPLAQFMM